MNLKVYRAIKGLTQEELSKKAKVCRTTISGLERSEEKLNDMKIRTLKRIAKALEIEITELL